ncbi:MAG: hypothetical protein NTX00_00370 [Candidatus Parcubacteria bacterium]|nr:hypothetical protein [Candidatus Parcubacteria bacterium]
MKKIVLICLFFLTILTLKVSADDAPFWTQKTVWRENGYVYSVGQAPYNDGMTNFVFAKNFNQALDNSVKNIKTELKVKQLKGFQIINTWYDKEKMFVLGSVSESANQMTAAEPEPAVSETITCPKANWWKETQVFICQNAGRKYLYAVGTSSNPDQTIAENQATAKANTLLKDSLKVSELKGFGNVGLRVEIQDENKQVWVLVCVPEDQNTAALNTREAPPAPPATPQDENAAFENAIKISGIDIFTTMPVDWWGLYKEGVKTFIYQDHLYSIGWNRVNSKFASNPTQSKELAQRGAEADARRNLLAAIKPIIRESRGKGNWQEKINGVVQGAEVANNVPNNPYFLDNSQMYVLMAIPLDKLKQIR